MSLPLDIGFTTCDWNSVPETEHRGETGCAYWKTQQYGDVRVRVVRYTPGYVADHWCLRGHVLFVMDGALTTELADGRVVELERAMSYAVKDDAMAHRSRTATGATLFIVD
jgi:hypothetical protein